MDNPFAKKTYGQVALQKIAPTDPDFLLYAVGWLETGAHPSTWDVMEVKGAVFREAKRGPRKGQKCIIVPGSKRTAYVTKAEMKAWEEKNTPEYKYEVNNCNCHPETCGCNPFKIVDREGNTITTAYTEEQARKVLEIMNK
jgi:hypothetical protein